MNVAITAVIFDNHGLLHRQIVPGTNKELREIVTEELQRLGIVKTVAQVDGELEGTVNYFHGKGNYESPFHEYFAGLGIADAAGLARRLVGSIVREQMPGASDCLAKLKNAGLTLAILSDTRTEPEKTYEHLTEIGLKEFFEPKQVITSSTIGYVKPDPCAYQAALTAVNVNKGEAVFIGHSNDELRGAKDYGLWTIGVPFLAEVRPENTHTIVPTIREVPKLVLEDRAWMKLA